MLMNFDIKMHINERTSGQCERVLNAKMQCISVNIGLVQLLSCLAVIKKRIYLHCIYLFCFDFSEGEVGGGGGGS